MSSKRSVFFTEDMHGFVGIPTNEFTKRPDEFQKLAKSGQLKNQDLKFRLTIYIENIDDFINDENLTAKATGYIESSLFEDRIEIDEGVFNLFVYPSSSPLFNAAKEMHYTLKFKDSKQENYIFYGYKVLEKQEGVDLWEETTTLYTQIFKGDQTTPPIYAGILKLNMEDFIKQLGTLDTEAQSIFDKIEVYYKFLNVFAGNVWEAYTPQIFNPERHQWAKHIFPVHTSKGVSNAKITHHFVDLTDGLTIQYDRFFKKETKNIVILLHGLSTSTDMFIMPEHYNLVQYLLNNEFTDVVSVDWRGSGRHKYNYIPNEYNIDYVAKYDLPEVLEAIKNEIGDKYHYHIVSHCVGSISTAASLASGQLTGIKSWVANSVSFTPQIPFMAKMKIKLAPFFLDNIFRYPYLSPQIPYLPGFGFAKWISLMERLIRKECDEPACHMVSFMWGWGFPGAYQHENLHVLTHRRIKDIFGATTTSYLRHLGKMISKKETIPMKREKEFYHLPESYLENLKVIDLPPTLLIAGSENRIFPGSNKLSFESIKSFSPNQNITYQEFKNYGHQDIFIGKNSDKDIFPSIIKFLKSNRGE